MSGCISGIDALIEMRTIPQIMSLGAGALQVSFSVVVSHFQPLRAITLVGFPVNHIAVLTVALLSNVVQVGASWALVISGIGWCCGSMGSWLGSMGGCCGRVGGCLAGVGALVEMRTITQILSIGAGALQVSFSVVVSHFQPLRAITLVGCPVNHVAVLTVALLSNVVQGGASWALVI